mmetsp:Transcript_4829/g.11496  ORF Transcript_4829/g.11496 Transcript_4829/m.11496 type:complete len:161 (+) Transcript_4829:181-663(+)
MRKKSELKYLSTILNKFNEQYKILMASSIQKNHKNSIFWKIYRLHWEKNRFIYNLRFNKKIISIQTFGKLCALRLVDTDLISFWLNPGYEILCSLSALPKLNSENVLTKKGSQCRVPIIIRLNSSDLIPDKTTGCISCASGDGMKGNPIWWNVDINFKPE